MLDQKVHTCTRFDERFWMDISRDYMGKSQRDDMGEKSDIVDISKIQIKGIFDLQLNYITMVNIGLKASSVQSLII